MSIIADRIYEAFPKHVAPADARRAIEKYIKAKAKEKGQTLFSAQLYTLSRTKEYAERVKRSGKERKFIPHPATWYNRGGPDEDQEEWGPEAPKPISISQGIDIEWVRKNWDKICGAYALRMPERIVISSLPAWMQALIQEAWEKR